jgi:hypothetical protein
MVVPISIWHMCRAKSVELVESIVIYVLHAGVFLLDAGSFCSAHLSLFSLHESLLRLLSFGLPSFPPVSPTQSISI